jgi:D-tyrosyl-tRNA(Tyr) deacylase
VIGLIQRVSQARVRVGGEVVGEIGRGLLALVGVAKEDTEARADRLLERLLGYRVFPDAEGRMNLGLRDVAGGLLLVSQFTLVADTRKGMRPSFSSGAPPEQGRRLFEHLVRRARDAYPHVATGVYAADMQVELINDGPVTFWLEG